MKDIISEAEKLEALGNGAKKRNKKLNNYKKREWRLNYSLFLIQLISN